MSEENQSDEESWEYLGAADQDLSGVKRLASERREVGLVGATLHGIARFFTNLLIRLFLKVEADGRDNLPADSPFVVVANHSSHLDALLISHLFPARFTGKFFSLAAADYFFDTPSKTIFATRWVNALPLRRGRSAGKALSALRGRIVSGDCILIVFPEGTRSRDGQLGKFKPGIGMLVAETSVPVIPVHLEGAHEIWPPERKFPRGGKIKIRIGAPETFEATSNDKEGWCSIASDLEGIVRSLGESS